MKKFALEITEDEAWAIRRVIRENEDFEMLTRIETKPSMFTGEIEVWDGSLTDVYWKVINFLKEIDKDMWGDEKKKE